MWVTGKILPVNNQEIRQLDKLEASHWWYRNRKVALKAWAKNLPPGSAILDAGSASGANTILLQSMGLSVSSLELSKYGCELQREKGISVTQGDICRIPWDENTFDAVICMDVLEHVEKDRVAISELTRVLRPNGSFLLTVPEDQRLWSEHDKAVNHIRRYSKKQFCHLLDLHGLKVEHAWSSNVALKPLVRLIRRKSTGSDLKTVPIFLNSLLLAWANIERLTFIRFLSGVTVWVTGKNGDLIISSNSSSNYE